ncbi:MAG TPA: cysteine hydrolase [Candidatus Limnocylindria bacterium]|nr:cysteine hydrolase [Candidatus Limnocylindria bacterium]
MIDPEKDRRHPIVPARTAMLFFDCLAGYLHPRDAAAAAEVVGSGIIQRLVRIERACREAGIAIVYAQADHRPDWKDVQRYVADAPTRSRPPGPHVFEHPGVASGDPRAEVIDEIAPRPGDYVIKKHRWSAFFGTHLELSLRSAGIDTLMLAGGAIEVGIASTAYAARDLGFSQVVLRDACRSTRPGMREAFMDTIFPNFARVRTVEEAIALFARP